MPDDTDVHGPWVIRILRLKLATPERVSTPHDGRFVKEYDPHRRGENLIQAHLVTTEDPREAQLFPTDQDATAAWEQDRGVGAHDLEPDRPLTAYTVELLPYLDAVAESGRGDPHNSGNPIDLGGVIDPGGLGEPWTSRRELEAGLAAVEEALEQDEAAQAEDEELRQRLMRSAVAAQQNCQRWRERLAELDAAIARAGVAAEQELVTGRATVAGLVASLEEREELATQLIAQGYIAFELKAQRILELRRIRDRMRNLLAQRPQEPGSADV